MGVSTLPNIKDHESKTGACPHEIGCVFFIMCGFPKGYYLGSIKSGF